MTTKRTRKVNYSLEENLFLADKFEEYKSIVDAKQKDSNTNRRKKEAWAEILRQHQARFPLAGRSMDDLKIRLSKLKSESRKRLLRNKKSQNTTEGGKPAKEAGPDEDSPVFKDLRGIKYEAVPIAMELCCEDGYGAEELHVPAKEESEELEIDSNSQSFESESFLPAFQQRETKHKSFDEFLGVKLENALLKRENLILEQQKLKLEVELLNRQLRQTAPTASVQMNDSESL